MFEGIVIQSPQLRIQADQRLPAATHISVKNGSRQEIILVADAQARHAEGSTLLGDVLSRVAEEVSSLENCYLLWQREDGQQLDETGNRLPSLRTLCESIFGGGSYEEFEQEASGDPLILSHVPQEVLAWLDQTCQTVLGMHVPSSFVVSRLYEAFFTVLYGKDSGGVIRTLNPDLVAPVTSAFLSQRYKTDLVASSEGYYALGHIRKYQDKVLSLKLSPF